MIAVTDGDTYNYSVELLEAKFPLLVRRYAYNVEAGVGAGQYRGGFGLVREYISKAMTSLCTPAMAEPRPGRGASTAEPAGSLNGIEVVRGDARRELTPAAALFAATRRSRCRPHRGRRRLGRASSA